MSVRIVEVVGVLRFSSVPTSIFAVLEKSIVFDGGGTLVGPPLGSKEDVFGVGFRSDKVWYEETPFLPVSVPVLFSCVCVCENDAVDEEEKEEEEEGDDLVKGRPVRTSDADAGRGGGEGGGGGGGGEDGNGDGDDDEGD